MSPDENGGETGARYVAEIREQPDALRRLLEHDADIARIAQAMHDRDARLVRLV